MYARSRPRVSRHHRDREKSDDLRRVTTYTYANIHDDCGAKDEVARGLDTYATISKPAIVPEGKKAVLWDSYVCDP